MMLKWWSDLNAYYRRAMRIYDQSMDMMGHSTQETYIVTGNTDAFGVFLGGHPSPTESPGLTKASATEPILISGEGGGGDAAAHDKTPALLDQGDIEIPTARQTPTDIMCIVPDADVTNPRTGQHSTVNGAGLGARVLRGKR